MGTLGKKILESLKVLPKWLTWKLVKLVNLIADFCRFVPREEFLEEDGDKCFPSGDRVGYEAIKSLLGIIF